METEVEVAARQKPSLEQTVRLFVTGPGVSTGNPELWPQGGYTLVLAESEAQALVLAGDLSGKNSHEVRTFSPMVVAHVPCD
jgi:hypothetical protein